jgi:hypothetical protein
MQEAAETIDTTIHDLCQDNIFLFGKIPSHNTDYIYGAGLVRRVALCPQWKTRHSLSPALATTPHVPHVSQSLSKKILSGDDFAALCETSFWSYVHARTDEFHHCPTPNCAQMHRSAPASSAILQCPSCLIGSRVMSGTRQRTSCSLN